MIYSRKIDDFHENLEDHNPTKKRRVLIVFHDMIGDMESNKTLSPIVTDLFLRGRKVNISLVFISKSYFKVPKTKTKCNTLFYYEKDKKRELHQIASNHSSSIDFKVFMKLSKAYTKET